MKNYISAFRHAFPASSSPSNNKPMFKVHQANAPSYLALHSRIYKEKSACCPHLARFYSQTTSTLPSPTAHGKTKKRPSKKATAAQKKKKRDIHTAQQHSLDASSLLAEETRASKQLEEEEEDNQAETPQFKAQHKKHKSYSLLRKTLVNIALVRKKHTFTFDSNSSVSKSIATESFDSMGASAAPS